MNKLWAWNFAFMALLLISMFWLQSASNTLSLCVARIENASPGQIANVLAAKPNWADAFTLNGLPVIPISIENLTFEREQIIAGGCYGLRESLNTSNETREEKQVAGKPGLIIAGLAALFWLEFIVLAYSFIRDCNDRGKKGNGGAAQA